MKCFILSFFVFLADAAQFQFRDGTTNTAELQNPHFTIHTSYGSLQVAATNLAHLQFGAAGQFDTIVTRNGNRFTGFVNDQTRMGEASLHKSVLNRISIEPVAPPSAQRFLVLANGDLLSGEFAITNLIRDGVESIWFEKNNVRARVQTADGKEIGADLPFATLNLVLTIGGEIQIPRELLKAIYPRAGTIPPEVYRLTKTAAIGGSGDSSAPTNMVWIPPGKVLLGSPLDERGRNSDEGPLTEVTITRGFWIAKFEITQGQYAAVMGQNPSTFQGDTNRPVEKVSWHDAMEYCTRLTEAARQDGSLPSGYIYRLPTEAEWEYACRAGNHERFSFGDDPAERELPGHGWFTVNSGWSTQPVGRLKPNPWGLYDMHGNVLEWCLGLWDDVYPGGQVSDYNGPRNGWLRVARGGSWLYGSDFARSANRDDYGPNNRCSDLGFRVVLGPSL